MCTDDTCTHGEVVYVPADHTIFIYPITRTDITEYLQDVDIVRGTD